MTAAEYDDALHNVIFFEGRNITNGNSFSVHGSELVIAALRASGLLDNIDIQATPPSDNTRLWFDTTQDPHVLRTFVSGTMTWDPVTYDDVFGAAAGVTNITVTENANNVVIDSSSGTGDTIPAATDSNAGVMQPLQFQKLDGIETNAEVNVQGDWLETDTNSDAFIRNKPFVDPGGGLGTSLTSTPDADSVLIDSSTGTGADVQAATDALAGVMSAADKSKLDGIDIGAEVNVQADWNQTDTGADDYIENKPTLGALSALDEVGAAQITDGSVGADELATDAVTEDKILNGAVTQDKIDPNVNLGGGPSLGTAAIMRTNAQTISENITVPTGTNAMTIGTVTIADTFTVTVETGAEWVVV